MFCWVTFDIFIIKWVNLTSERQLLLGWRGEISIIDILNPNL